MELNASTGYAAFHISADERSDLLNDFQFGIFEIVNYVCMSTIISFFGIAGNVFNIIIFLNQGFQNTINISFFGLAISDLCCLITLLWVVVWLNPFMRNSETPVNALEIQYLTGSWPHAVFGRITSFITVYVTAERCLCILFPLKIRQLVTPTTTATVVCSIFIINFLMFIPEYATSYLDWRFYPVKNKTILAIAYRSGREQGLIAAIFCVFFFSGILAFVALMVFTATLAFKLQRSSEWRKEAVAGSDQESCVTTRQKKTIKMVVVIATVLIVCYTPGSAISFSYFFEPELHVQGRYRRLCLSLWSIACVFNAINSSINILLYYSMSSKYRQTFNSVILKRYKAGGTGVC